MRALAVLVSLAAVLPVAAHAQLELGAFVGVLAPTSQFELPASSFFGTVTIDPTTSLTYGAVARAWFGDRLGAQATYSGTSGSIAVGRAFGSDTNPTFDASSGAFTLGVLYQFTTPTLPNKVWASVGAVWMHMDSEYYDSTDVSASVGVTLGAGSTLPVWDGRLLVNLMLDTFIYTVTATTPGLGESSGTQLDFRAVAGLSVPILLHH